MSITGAKGLRDDGNNGIPFLSVIIPAFNEERYLPATLQAVAKSASLLRLRESVNTEVIVVDNDSTDETAKAADAHGARVITEPEHNIARVRNRGAAEAQGKVLVFLDADTYMPEEVLPRIHGVFATAGFAGGAVDTEYRPTKRSIRLYLKLWSIAGRAAGMSQGATQFCLRETFDAIGGYDESLFMGEDIDFYTRMRKHGRSVGEQVRLIDEIKVVPSCRRFDQWAVWRTLLWTNPLVIAPLRHARAAWRGWYDSPVR